MRPSKLASPTRPTASRRPGWASAWATITATACPTSSKSNFAGDTDSIFMNLGDGSFDDRTYQAGGRKPGLLRPDPSHRRQPLWSHLYGWNLQLRRGLQVQHQRHIYGALQLHRKQHRRGPNPGPDEASNGDLYGVAQKGGSSNDGTIYSISTSGTLLLAVKSKRCPHGRSLRSPQATW